MKTKCPKWPILVPIAVWIYFAIRLAALPAVGGPIRILLVLPYFLAIHYIARRSARIGNEEHLKSCLVACMMLTPPLLGFKEILAQHLRG